MSQISQHKGDSTGLEPPRSRDERTVFPEDAEALEASSVWRAYNNKAHHYDADLIKDAEKTVDVLLIFAGLFSAVVTAFISQTYPMLKPDPTDLLLAILNELRGTPGLDVPFSPPKYATRVNCFLFTGLFTSIFVSLLGILVKQWARSYERDLEGVSSPHLRARIRHYRYVGAKKWQLDKVVGSLSIFMHLALFISAIGIIDLLLSTARVVGAVVVSIFSLGALAFLATTALPLFFRDAPFRSPLSRALVKLKMLAVPQNAPTKALDEFVHQSQGGESDENSFARSKLLLDLDILCYLLAVADKSTERASMEACFEKMPSLHQLTTEHSSSIISREIILQTYIYLARGCISTQKGRTEVVSKRLRRAKVLCKFLSWYMQLCKSSNELTRVWNLLRAENFDPLDLPERLREDDTDESILIGSTTSGILRHFHDQSNRSFPCEVCQRGSKTLRGKVANAASQGKARVMAEISLQLISQTDCLLRQADGNPNPNDLDDTARALATNLISVMESYPSMTNPRMWKKILEERQKRPTKWSHILLGSWFAPLLQSINNNLTPGRNQRNASNYQLTLNTSNTGPSQTPGSGGPVIGHDFANVSHPLASSSSAALGLTVTPPTPT